MVFFNIWEVKILTEKKKSSVYSLQANKSTQSIDKKIME